MSALQDMSHHEDKQCEKNRHAEVGSGFLGKVGGEVSLQLATVHLSFQGEVTGRIVFPDLCEINALGLFP